MIEPSGDWAQTIVLMLALADRLEGHGQLNIAKLVRASADSLARRAAYDINLPRDSDKMVSALNHLLPAMSGFGLTNALTKALSLGARAMEEGRLPLIDEAPDPYVCRTCGELAMTEPATSCSVCGAWPSTFQRFAPIYWLDELQPGEALAQLRSTPEKIAALLAGLNENHLSRPAADGGWSIRQVLSHLRDAEGVLRFRLQLMAEQDNPVLESLAVFNWATSEENRPSATTEIFKDYRNSRQDSLAILQALPAWDWWRTGRHKEFGEVTILRQASYFATHEQTHLATLEELHASGST